MEIKKFFRNIWNFFTRKIPNDLYNKYQTIGIVYIYFCLCAFYQIFIFFSIIDKYNLFYNKIASAMITNVDFVKRIADKKKYTYISTGMSDYKNIDEVVKIFKLAKCEFELMRLLGIETWAHV